MTVLVENLLIITEIWMECTVGSLLAVIRVWISVMMRSRGSHAHICTHSTNTYIKRRRV